MSALSCGRWLLAKGGCGRYGGWTTSSSVKTGRGRMRTRWTDFSEEAGMKRLPPTVVMMGVILLACCHCRREGVKSLLGDGVEQ